MNRLSNKISVLSIAAMFSVVLIHSITILTAPSPAQWSVFVQHLISRTFTDWAVPFFFAVSGFWFAKSLERGDAIDVFYRRKWRTLVIPYLFWALIGLLVALPLIIGNNILQHRSWYERTLFEIPGIWSKIDALFAISHAGPKGNAPLWYVRSLMVMFLFFPLWRFLWKKTLLFMLLVVIGGGLEISPYAIEVPYLKVYGFAWGWFALGLASAKFGIAKKRIPSWLGIASWIAFIVFSVGKALYIASYIPCFRLSWLIPVAGIVGIWWLYDLVIFNKVQLPWALRQTFFIYCLHEIICGYFISASHYILGKGDVVNLILLLAVPVLAIVVCMFIAKVWHRLWPSGYGIVTGGREN